MRLGGWGCKNSPMCGNIANSCVDDPHQVGISLNATTSISDLAEVGSSISKVWNNNDMGYLHSYGIHVSWRRVWESLLRVSPRLVESRATTTVACRQYNVASSNTLWHIDGLVWCRIVVHGGIDGSRQIAYLHVSDNNRAQTVLHYFTCATRKYGWPSQVRSDHDGVKLTYAEPW